MARASNPYFAFMGYRCSPYLAFMSNELRKLYAENSLLPKAERNSSNDIMRCAVETYRTSTATPPPQAAEQPSSRWRRQAAAPAEQYHQELPRPCQAAAVLAEAAEQPTKVVKY